MLLFCCSRVVAAAVGAVAMPPAQLVVVDAQRALLRRLDASARRRRT